MVYRSSVIPYAPTKPEDVIISSDELSTNAKDLQDKMVACRNYTCCRCQKKS
jgi:hypothetical protein